MKYIRFKELEKYGYTAVHTTLEAGNMKEKENLDVVLSELNINKELLIKGNQTHSTNIVCIDDSNYNQDFDNVDGYITNNPKFSILTYYADCLPLFLLDPKNNVFGLLHGGWRGSANKILEKGIDMMKEKYNSSTEDIIVCFGVGIKCKNYEIKQDTVDILKTLLDFDNMIIYEGDKIYLDNAKLNEQIALNLGIKSENIIKNDYCSYDDNFHSYRRDKNDLRSAAIFSRKVMNEK